MDTKWTPRLTQGGPRYRALAEEIARAVEERRLLPGERLPPVRDLAWTLEVTPGTVARAYQLAERRGLVQGQVGRGTYVRERGAAPAPGAAPPPDPTAAASADLRHNHAPEVGQDAIITAALGRLISRDGPLSFTTFAHAGADEPERAAVVDWFATGGLPARAEDIVFCAGAQHGVFIAYAACLGGRDAVALTAPLIHPAIKDCARALGVRLEPVAADADGVRPDAIEEAIERVRPGAMVLSANLHNPTLATMPPARREAIAEIALRRRLPIIEDDVYGWIDPAARPPSFPNLAPDLTWYATSLSKCAGSLLRAGFILTPPGQGPRTARLLRGFTSHMPYLTAQLTAELIRSGDLDRIVARVQVEVEARARTARETMAAVLGAEAAAAYLTDERVGFSWLRLPDPWRASDLVAAAAEQGVLISPAEVFTVGRAVAPHAVRLAFGAAADRDALANAVRVVAELVRAGPAPADIVA